MPGGGFRLICDAHTTGIVPPGYPDAALVNEGRRMGL
jgi:hypothetical protein